MPKVTGKGPAARKRPRRAGGAATISVVGAGRAGSALAILLSRAGWPISAVASLHLVEARRLAARCGAKLATRDAALAANQARIVLIAVSDRAIPEVVRALAGVEGPRAALHTSGATGAGILAPLRRRGWTVGSFHPLIAFPPPSGDPPSLEGVTLALDGDPPSERLARAMARSLKARPLVLPEAERAAYHLAACLASNYVVTLAAEAAQLLSSAGLGRVRALGAILPLLHSTIEGLGQAGLPDALTGPVARGDAVTVRRHATMLAGAPSELRALHRLLVRRTIRLALASDLLDRKAAIRIERALRR